ncbi:hypothetical protein DFH08DRAFT_881378 [Mycena albidolilacea]|uniref:Uncharacterized protein n=1 Tax=Mycena albidolilacea TaxID=1033008 RepID=A0AAD6ZP97_9AGAR|nr:hypothetical protein DFH08DRAFT_881378 [Mycena albidolilacea]
MTVLNCASPVPSTQVVLILTSSADYTRLPPHPSFFPFCRLRSPPASPFESCGCARAAASPAGIEATGLACTHLVSTVGSAPAMGWVGHSFVFLSIFSLFWLSFCDPTPLAVGRRSPRTYPPRLPSTVYADWALDGCNGRGDNQDHAQSAGGTESWAACVGGDG